jgi:hypothetical protein
MNDDVGTTIKQGIAAIILFIIGFIAALSFYGSIGMAIAGGWCVGGVVCGWFLTRGWFRPSISISDGGINSFMEAARFIGRIAVIAAVGTVAMPVFLIKFIIVIVRAKSANQGQSNASYSSPPVSHVSYSGETWTCKECKEENPITSPTCKSCGAYK